MDVGSHIVMTAPIRRYRRRALRAFLVLPLIALAALRCSKSPTDVARSARTFRMGFSAVPPKLEVQSAIATINMWSTRGDAALLALTPPWKAMLADTNPAVIIRREQTDLVNFYRSKGMQVVAMIDATDGLSRDKEATELVAAGRSIKEPAIQALYREYVMAVDSILHPDYLALAMETNLIRALAPADVYDAVRVMTNATATALHNGGSHAKLYVSVQVETAWGRLPATGSYVGISADLHDFPFIEALGLSSYPYLGGFAQPEDVPLDYYKRLADDAKLPVLVVEGGWSSASVPGASSSPDKQARYIARQMALLDTARAIGVFQITFTDIDLASWNLPSGSILPLFAYLGLVTADFTPKPALMPWDAAFARPLQQ